MADKITSETMAAFLAESAEFTAETEQFVHKTMTRLAIGIPVYAAIQAACAWMIFG